MEDKLKAELFSLMESKGVVRVVSSRFFYASGGSVAIRQTLKSWIKGSDVTATTYPALVQHLYEEDKRVDTLLDLIAKTMAEYNSIHNKSVAEDIGFKSVLESFEGFQVCQDMSSNSLRYFLYDFENHRELVGVDGERVLHHLNSYRDKGDAPVSPIPIYGEYNPYRYLEPIYKKELFGREVDVINRFSPPEWMLMPELKEPVLNPLVKRFFELLIPNDEQRKMVFAWIRNMIVNRNGTILTLNGPRSTGKTILGEKILPPLVGHGNFRKSGEGFLKKEFNSIMSKTRLVYVDEFPLTNDGMTKIKNYLNDAISIEGKGQDERMEQNFCSILYSSNNITDIALKWDERRFSIIETRKESLLKDMNGSEISQLVEVMKDPEVVYNLAHWMIKYGEHPEYSDINFHYKGDHFYRLVRANLTNWQRAFLEGVRQDVAMIEEFDFKHIKKKYFRDLRYNAPDNMGKLSDFLNNFKSRNGEYVGHIAPSKFDENTPVFIANMKFFKTWSDDIKRDFEHIQKESQYLKNDKEDAHTINEIINEQKELDDIF